MIALDRLWGPPPANLLLPSDSIHVWCVSLDQSPSRIRHLAQVLAGDERMKAERYHFAQDRRRFIAGRGLLRTILGRYLRIEPSRLQFRYACHGKPALTESFCGGMLRFNLSHSQEFALYAITRGREIGIDLECIRPISDVEQLAARCFSAHENTVFRALPAHERLEAFFNCWTRKEAYLKALGDGMARPLDGFDVSLAPGEPARLLRIEGDPQEASHWFLQELTPASGYVAALAGEGHDWQLKCWRWAG